MTTPTGRRIARPRLGDPALDQAVLDLVDAAAIEHDRDLVIEMVASVLKLGRGGNNRGDMKLASTALRELRTSFASFNPYRDSRKCSVFGSARTRPDEPAYVAANLMGAALAKRDWMVITGGGPGIMTAAIEGAGPDASFGVTIRLPFESAGNGLLPPERLVPFRYFFTRKLTFMKESSAYVAFPGGFGTLDETFELLTLTQTGKGLPVPIVFLDTPGDPYWEAVDHFVNDHLVARGLVNAIDRSLYRITDSCDEAVAEVTRFYANYHSVRVIGDDLVLRMRRGPDDEQLAGLNARYAHLATDGAIRRVEPYSVERRQQDHLDLARIAFGFDRHGYAALRPLIDEINTYP